MSTNPNVILLIFDSLRADVVSRGEGPFSVETPAFDGVAERGTSFENAFSAGPWTPPAHGTMFSGRYPSETGFHGGTPTMPESFPLVADWFRGHGYDTYGIPGPAQMGSPTGLDRGFDRYYEVYEEVAERPSPEYVAQLVTDPLVRRDFFRLAGPGNDYFTEIKFDRLRDWLGSAKGTEDPFFAMTNVTTVHAPYDPPRPYKQEATSELTRPRFGLVEELFDDSGAFDDPEVDDERLFAACSGAESMNIGLSYYDDPAYLSERELDVLRQWYAASVRYLDDRLAEFLEWFGDAGLEDDTILVLTSDHGEFFGEHGGLYHGDFLYDEVTRVPLIFAGPGIPAGERRTDLVSLVDLFASLCDLCGLDDPPTAGTSLFGDGEREAVFAEKAPSDLGNWNAASVVSDETLREFELGKKSIRTEDYRFELRSDGSEVLYRLPDETPVADPDEGVVADLRARLVETLGDSFDGDAGGTEGDYSPGVERNLRNLGYID